MLIHCKVSGLSPNIEALEASKVGCIYIYGLFSSINVLYS